MRICILILLSWTWWHLLVDAQEEECKNTLSICASLKSFCSHPEHKDFTRSSCPETCKRCPKDIDPKGLCRVNNGGCEHACDVKNKDVKECSCYEGYQLNKDGHSCDDIDECDHETCPIGHYCRNLQGSFACEKARCGGATSNYMGRAECCRKEPSDAQCGITGVPDRRIIGGKTSYLGQWPWQVLIYIDRQNLCGGTLINANWVLTAGHCFKGHTSKTKIELFHGALDRNKLTRRHVQKRVMKRHVLYPNWDEERFETNDVALVELDRPVTITKWVRPVCLPNGEKPKVGYKCFAAGWGLTEEEGSTPAVKMQHVDLPIADGPTCEYNYRNEDVKVNKTIMICAGYEEGGKDACRGDSGGPLVCQRCDSCGWYLAGVVSFGSGCAQKGFYGVYADVHYYEKWISKVTSIPVTNERSCTGPHFTQWSKWSQCTKSCGTGGKHTRTRQCLHKGKTSDKCSGPKENTENCPVRACPIFGAWGDWSECTVTCGSGEQSQIRKCRNGKIGQDGCPTDEASRKRSCNTEKCPFWKSWGSWGSCSKTCGKGKSERSRKCVGGKAGVQGCDGKPLESKECNPDPCPGWTPWGPWEKCPVTCGGGKQMSSRTCVGKGSCPGSDTRDQPCNEQPCPVFGKWGLWDSCDASCGSGKRHRTRPCENGKIGDAGCEKGREIEEQACNTDKCPEFSSWSSWAKCSVTCGGGNKKATRSCLHGVPGDEGCVGPLEKVQQCATDECIGKFGRWGEWSSCSKTCDDGSQKRSRPCERGTKCIGKSEESRTCKVKNCPVFGDWSDWGDCSKTCGGGQHTRMRECLYTTNPKDCKGVAEQSEQCNDQLCPGKWSKWSSWSQCDVTCGDGNVKRSRKCQGGEIGKIGCDDGPADQTKTCAEDPCPSSWGEWENWSSCSKSCDRGLQARTRPCDGGRVGKGGCVPASGAKEEKKCNEVLCSECYDVDDGYCNLYFDTQRKCEQSFDYGQRFCPKKCNFCPQLYENWNPWGPCSATCGSGTRRRTRECKNVRFGCEGSSSERGRCRGPCKGFTQWTEWGECSESCNGGTRSRTRECPFEKCEPDETGSSSLTDEERCNVESCPGVWEKWSDWGSCSVTCGDTGVETRTRKCIGGTPGGPGCPGSDQRTRPCSESKRCPGKWTDWTDWSKCSVTCGKGQREKSRKCENGVQGQPDCMGEAKKSESCDAGECVAKWGEWGDWGECDSECIHARTRKCNGGKPGSAGCEGSDSESESCDPSSCGGGSQSCDALSPDTDRNCFSVDDKTCLHVSAQQACPKRCCEALNNLPCEDEPEYELYCRWSSLCEHPQYVDVMKWFCRLTCGTCTP